MGANLILPAGSAADSTPADPVTRSLRFDGSSSKLTRTPSSASSATACTISFWVKRGKTDEENTVFHAGTASGDRGHVRFNSNNTLEAACYNGSWFVELKTNAVYRDPSAFYHIFVSIDTTNGTGKLFVNGEEPSLQTNTTTSSSTVLPFGKTIEHQIGQRGFDSTGYHDGLVSDFYFIDGTALSTPVDQTISSTGYGSYKPKAFDMSSYSGNSFHLKFEDSSDIGADSANSNDFTATNLASHDVMLDVPTKNYATLNPLQKAGTNGDGPFEGNLSLLGGGNPSVAFSSTIAANNGKYYAEFHLESLGYPTVSVADTSLWVGNYGSGRVQGNGAITYDIVSASTTGQYFINSTTGGSALGISPATDDIIQVAFDADTRKVWFGRNGTWNGSGNPANGTNHVGVVGGTDALTIVLRAEVSGSNGTMVSNYGQDPTFAGGASSRSDSPDTSQGEFYFAPPTGFKSLNTSNLGTPTVTPEENFNIALYNGNSSSNAITGLGFEPSLLWTKSRSTSGTSHKIYDSVRGVTKKLEADNTTAEGTVSDLTSFDSDGFTLGSGNGSNYSGRTYVGWNWKAHQSPTSSSTRTTYTVKVEDNSGDAWDAYGSWYDSSTYLPSVYMEIFENRNSSLVSLGKVAVRYYDSSGNSNSDLSEQTYTLECADLNAIAVKWHYDTSGDGQEYDYPNYYNDYLNDQKITILDGTTSTSGTWLGVTGQSGTNNYSNDDGTSSNYSPPTGWANGDTLKSATTSYNGSDTATLTSDSGVSDPVEKYNSAAGFTIISYSGNGSSSGDTQELNHSLGVPLEFVIAKARTSNDGYDNGDWIVYHKDLTSNDYLMLNSSAAADTPYEGYDIISTSVSGSQHKVVVGNDYDSGASYGHYLNSGPDNGTGEDYILYGWAGVEGYSKFGKYTGNGVADGPFVYTGFRPAFVLWKRATGSSNSWNIMDNKREGYNPQNDLLFPDSSTSESNVTDQDLLSNGFKLRTTGAGRNATSETFIYAAFAEQPFAAPSNAR